MDYVDLCYQIPNYSYRGDFYYAEMDLRDICEDIIDIKYDEVPNYEVLDEYYIGDDNPNNGYIYFKAPKEFKTEFINYGCYKI